MRALLLLLACALPACAPADSDAVKAPVRPNVLVILTDDLAKRAVGAYGAAAGVTPALDTLAAEGSRFAHAVCSTPLCTPSRHALLSGRHPHTFGAGRLKAAYPLQLPTLAQVFRDAGYATAAFGKLHLNREWNNGQDFGFDEHLDQPDWVAGLTPAESETWQAYRTIWRTRHTDLRTRYNMDRMPLELPDERQFASYLVDHTLEFVERERDQPFLAFCSLYEPHVPFTFPTSFAQRIDPATVKLPATTDSALERNFPALWRMVRAAEARRGKLDDKGLQELTAAYLQSVAWADSQIGRLLTGLEARGLLENTLIVFASDHGFLLGEHGTTAKAIPLAEAIEVPLILRGPGVPAGALFAEPVQLIDIFATVCEAAHVPLHAELNSRSLWSMLRGEEHEDAAAFCSRPGSWASLQTARWKLVLGGDARRGFDQLYDLERDRDEIENLFDSESASTERQALISKLHEFYLDAPPLARNGSQEPPDLTPLQAVRWAISRSPGGAGNRDAAELTDE